MAKEEIFKAASEVNCEVQCKGSRSVAQRRNQRGIEPMELMNKG